MLKFYLSHKLYHVQKERHGFLRFWGLAKPFAQNSGKTKCQQGFTLLELLVVIGLLGIVGLTATTYIIDTGEIKRQDETEQRWDAIRKAIIGEPNLSLNGSPYVAGYVADMGRLPSNIQELFIQGSQPAWTEIDLYTAASGYSAAFGGGWRGPYLYTAGSRFYRDGWNNEDANAANDTINFGWNVTLTGTAPDYTDIAIQSFGDDNQVGGVEFNEDFPSNAAQNMVSYNEWTLSTAPITFNVQFNRAVQALDIPLTNPLQLKIYRYVDDGNATADAGDVDETVADITFILTTGLTVAPAQTVTLTSLPIGRFAVVVWCTQNDNLPLATANYTNDVVYDGDCDGGNINHSPVYFTINSATTQVTITWNLP